ncbi:tRNA dihydrouridine(20/20a) synthase DusA [Lautropia mirabilis]
MSVATPALVLPAGFRVSVAPMMDWTDRHCRSFHRLLSRRTWLYTEMVTAQAIAHGDLDHLLGRGEEGDRVVLQLGGNDPQLLARAAREGQAYGYDEINLNCGCPSDRVREGAFGACLMAEPERVADCMAAMQAVVQVPVTVKHRIGIDRREDYEFVHRFVDVVAAAGCRRFVVHARNAWLDGLDPKQNREIPPLRYEVVHRLAQDFPHCAFELNGGLQDLAHGLATVCPVGASGPDSGAASDGSGLDSATASEGPAVADATAGAEAGRPATRLVGAMYGRRAYHDPWLLAGVDDWLARHAAEAPMTEAAQPLTRAAVVEALVGYLERGAAHGVEVRHLARHVLGLYLGQPAARLWRRMLSESRALSRNDPGLLREACAAVEAEAARVAQGRGV